ncbi:spore germination protein (amino acid permease) [Fontibacillus phaseoli]|uniref:Spore germination protein (Amino acid permease) n=1 Tax=Fontibacillus phaseoli TaxID=1416533 RepID=A0A369BGA7_9BACL|nr:GerAB/ArcD/ProY family transporter [Fontibacillus phaseoli]RCX20583.1 spore germination protein (amino acid permease) [Fontibacillus phaseoli]
MSQEKLNRFFIALMIHSTQTGVVIFTLPRIIATHFGANGWVALIIMFFLVSLNIMLINSVYRLGKGQSVFAILKSGLPRFLLIPIYLVLGSGLAMVGCLVVKQYVLIYQMLIFPQTPDMLLKLVIDILVFIFVTKGIYTMSKANFFFLFLLFLMIPFSIVFIQNMDLSRMTPFLFQEGNDLGKGIISMYGAFMGYELSIFLFPYAEKGKKWLKYIHLGNGLTLFIYLLVTILCFGFFNYKELVHLSFPLLDMFGYLRFPFVERIQNFLYSFFLLSIIFTSGMYYWCSQSVFTAMIPKLHWKWALFFLIGITYFIAYIPKSLIIVEKWFGFLSYFQLGVAIGLPLLALLALLLKKGRQAHA